jgi:hypothetical protein
MLSDEDRSAVIEPLGLAPPTDRRTLALPAVIVVSSDGDEVYRWTSREFAFRLPEDELIGIVEGLDLPPTTQDVPQPGRPAPGPGAMPIRAMAPYFRGARFAAVALARRHPEIEEDVSIFTEQMDRWSQAVRDLKARVRAEDEAVEPG